MANRDRRRMAWKTAKVLSTRCRARDVVVAVRARMCLENPAPLDAFVRLYYSLVEFDINCGLLWLTQCVE